jgi:hypothetical protein
MRLLAIGLLAASACSSSALLGNAQGEAIEAHIRARPNVDAARDLDQEGVHAFRDGRYADAIRYFRSAYRLGGPPSELWNIARSYERLDDAESAATNIERYLAQRDLSPQDRLEAERELRALRSRSSTLTITTAPPGAVVTLDNRQTLGPTPLSVELPAGAHTIAIRHEGYLVETYPLEARFGRAVIVSLDLMRAGK